MAIKQSRNIHLEVCTFPLTSFICLEFTGQKGAYYHSFSHALTPSEQRLKKPKTTTQKRSPKAKQGTTLPPELTPRRAQLHQGFIYTGNPPKGATIVRGSTVLVTFLIRNE